MPNRLQEQTRISILNWNTGLRRGTRGAIEQHMAGKWHVITLQESSEYLQHECLACRFRVSHFAGCAVLFNKDTFQPDLQVSSVYIHDRKLAQTEIKEGEAGWVFQAVISRAKFKRVLRNGKAHFTMMSLHFNNCYAKKRGIARTILVAARTVMLQEQVDMVAGDFNGAARRREWSEHQMHDSSIEEAFSNSNLPIPHGLTPLWGPGGIPGEWADVWSFIKPPGSETEWRIRNHGAFSINRDVLGIRPTDQSCHHEVWIHLLHVNAHLVDRDNMTKRAQGRRPSDRKRVNPYDHM